MPEHEFEAQLLDLLARGEPIARRIVGYWGVPGSGKTHQLKIVHDLADKRQLKVYPVDFLTSSDPEQDLARINTAMLAGAEDGQGAVILIDNMPNQWDWDEDVFDRLFDQIIELSETFHGTHSLIFMAGYSQILKPQIHPHEILLLDRDRTAEQVAKIVTASTNLASFHALSAQIFRVTCGLPQANAIAAAWLADQSASIRNDVAFRAQEANLIKHLAAQMRVQQKQYFPTDLYQCFRSIAVCRYFDDDILGTIHLQGQESLKPASLIKMMCSKGVVRYENSVNTFEVDRTLRQIIIRDWLATNDQAFYEHCELALRAYEKRLAEKEKSSSESPAALERFLRDELALLARIYRRYESPARQVETILRERLLQHLDIIYRHFNTNNAWTGVIGVLTSKLESDDDLRGFRHELIETANDFIDRHTTAVLQISVSTERPIHMIWSVREIDNSTQEGTTEHAGGYVERIDQQIREGRPDVERIGEVIFNNLTPSSAREWLDTTRQPLQIEATSYPIPYELMRFSDDTYLGLRRPVGRTLRRTTEMNLSARSRARVAGADELQQALVVVSGAGYNDAGGQLLTNTQAIADKLNEYHIKPVVLKNPSSSKLQDELIKQYDCIHISGYAYAEPDPFVENRINPGILCSDGVLVSLERLKATFQRQPLLVFFDLGRAQAGPSQSMAGSVALSLDQIDRAAFLDMLDQGLTEADSKFLCYCLGVDYENLPGATKREKLLELIMHLARRNKLDTLLNELAKREHLRDEVQRLRAGGRPIAVADGSAPYIELTSTVVYAETAYRYGAQYCVANLWGVAAVSASLFASEFYERIGRGLEVGEAVRYARQQLHQAHGTRPDWASYVLYGAPRRILCRSRQQIDRSIL